MEHDQFNMYDIVSFKNDLTKHHVKQGDEGTILEWLNNDTVMIELADPSRSALNKIIDAPVSQIKLIRAFISPTPIFIQ